MAKAEKMQGENDPGAGPTRTEFMLVAEQIASKTHTRKVGVAVVAGSATGASKDVNIQVDQPQSDAARWVEKMILVRDAQDQTAFTELFAHFAPMVKAYLIRSGASRQLAEDCAQEVMATVWRKAALYDPSRASVATWVFTIARNRRIDMIRKERRPEPEELTWGPEEEPAQEDVVALQQESDILAKAIQSLPEKQRELVEAAYFGDLSHSEIAAETGLPLGTIKSRLRLALDRLRHAMK